MGQEAALPEERISEAPIIVLQPTLVRYQVLAAACVCAFIAYIHRVGFASTPLATAPTLRINHLAHPYAHARGGGTAGGAR